MILDLFKLDGKVAIVTGATTGLGQGMSLALAEAGADVAGVGSSGKFGETQTGVEAAGRGFLGIQADLRRLEPLDDIVRRTRERFGRIDILVNNAGFVRRSPSLEYGESDWDDVVNIHLKTCFFLSQKVARVFVEQGGGGKIINIASMLSYSGGLYVPSYAAAKSGVAGLTRALCNEWAAKGINVNAIAPGYFETLPTEGIRKEAASRFAARDHPGQTSQHGEGGL
jgi:2-deoxy-D-gluconate 3-dehydrogenase